MKEGVSGIEVRRKAFSMLLQTRFTFMLMIKIPRRGSGRVWGKRGSRPRRTNWSRLARQVSSLFFSILMDLSHISLSPRLGQRDPVDDDVGGASRRSVVSR